MQRKTVHIVKYFPPMAIPESRSAIESSSGLLVVAATAADAAAPPPHPPPSEGGDSSRKRQQKVYSNYRVTKIVGDGRCLFRSVAHGACLRFNPQFWSTKSPDQIEDEQSRMADALRTETVDELVRRREESQWFILGKFVKYVRRMRLPSTFGGELELLMLSHVLQHPLTVYMARTEKELGGRGVVVVAKYGQEEYGRAADSRRKRPIQVLYHRLKRHYEALQVFSSKTASSGNVKLDPRR